MFADWSFLQKDDWFLAKPTLTKLFPGQFPIFTFRSENNESNLKLTSNGDETCQDIVYFSFLLYEMIINF